MDDWAWYNIPPRTIGFSFSAPWECTLSVPWVALLVVRLMKDCLEANPLQGTKLKYVVMQLNTFVNFLRKLEPDVIWLRGWGILLECTPRSKLVESWDRMQLIEKQPSVAILSIIDGEIFIIFLIERTLSKQR